MIKIQSVYAEYCRPLGHIFQGSGSVSSPPNPDPSLYITDYTTWPTRMSRDRICAHCVPGGLLVFHCFVYMWNSNTARVGMVNLAYYD
ncbi:uncharacterized protein BP01DRAFT_355051 [Aspergillus saccharolyticus JOP 1030-1]|uniref:Uncharacterized protein n=1 Tax=Aspergillus saccharolyticus JOP 1030-1 TaxID=1450539 RepID=A0A318ZIC7_9EURO|nr:hypothetical protein BP01DRAFT_355051 [Aspergillus saccharolyticus JOP 1030-1]PYH47259.1 hypothetical protein BP01DRAFT_355051 [Aspergillus saccharolyticus JOP 1030-1]